jgi:hypothetical protein
MANTTRFPGSVPPPPGGGGGSGGPSKKSTAVRKISTASAPPTTRRVGAAPGSRARDREEDAGGRYGQQAPAPEASNTNLYIGIGVGALVLIIVVAMMVSGGDSEGGGGSGSMAWISRTFSEAGAARDSGQYGKAVDLCEKIMRDPKARKHPRWGDIQMLAQQCRDAMNIDSRASSALSEFKAKLEKAKSDGSAMKRANDLLREAKELTVQYRMTPSGNEFMGLRDGIQRWANTEASSDWLKDYNPNKSRIEQKYLSVGDYAGAVKEWNQFREVSTASDLKSRIDSEIQSIDIASSQAAEKIVAEAGTGEGARGKIEEKQTYFLGTEGQRILKKALSQLK